MLMDLFCSNINCSKEMYLFPGETLHLKSKLTPKGFTCSVSASVVEVIRDLVEEIGQIFVRGKTKKGRV